MRSILLIAYVPVFVSGTQCYLAFEAASLDKASQVGSLLKLNSRKAWHGAVRLLTCKYRLVRAVLTGTKPAWWCASSFLNRINARRI